MRFVRNILLFIVVHTLRMPLPHQTRLRVGKLIDLHILVQIVFKLDSQMIKFLLLFLIHGFEVLIDRDTLRLVKSA
jgi:hypothetical protein